MNPCETVALVTTLAIVISEQVSNNEQLELLSAVITQLGDTLATISLQRTESKNRGNSSLENPII